MPTPTSSPSSNTACRCLVSRLITRSLSLAVDNNGNILTFTRVANLVKRLMGSYWLLLGLVKPSYCLWKTLDFDGKTHLNINYGLLFLGRWPWNKLDNALWSDHNQELMTSASSIHYWKRMSLWALSLKINHIWSAPFFIDQVLILNWLHTQINVAVAACSTGSS